jgi:hypothetical protein
MKKPIAPAIHPSSFILYRQGYPRRFGAKMKDEASYHCDSCDEEIVVPIDLTAGSSQESEFRSQKSEFRSSDFWPWTSDL